MNAVSLHERVIALAEGVGPRGSARAVLAALAWFADRGVEDPPQAWLALQAGVQPRQVANVLCALEGESAGGPWIVRDAGQSAEGRFRRTRYEIVAEKLNGASPPWAEEVARIGQLRAAWRAVGNVVENVGSPSPVFASPSAIHDSETTQIAHGPSAICDSETTQIAHGGDTREREGARARPVHILSSPYVLDFDFGDDETKRRALAVLGVCGVGLAALDERTAPGMLGSLAQLLNGDWAAFDFNGDVLPVVSRRMAKVGSAGPLRDFWLLTDNIRAGVAKRQAREARARERAAGRGRGDAGRASNGFERGAASGGDELDRWLKRSRGEF